MEVKGKKEQLVESAMSLILKKGYSHTSVEDITNDVGIAKGSFYTYFKSKNLLLVTIIDSKINDVLENQKNQMGTSRSFDEILWKNINSRVKFSGDNLKRELVLINLIRNIDVLGREIRDLLVKLEELNIEFIEKAITKYKDELKVDVKDITRYSQMLNAVIRDFKMTNIFFDTDGKDNFFVRDMVTAEKKMNDGAFDDGIEFIYQNTLKVLK